METTKRFLLKSDIAPRGEFITCKGIEDLFDAISQQSIHADKYLDGLEDETIIIADTVTGKNIEECETFDNGIFEIKPFQALEGGKRRRKGRRRYRRKY